MKIRRSREFRRQEKALAKQHADLKLLDEAVTAIYSEDHDKLKELKDHPLKGRFKGDRELHVGGTGDWLLRYGIEGERITLWLLATGTHRDVLGIE